LLATLDPLTPALAIAVDLACVPLFGLRLTRLARLAWPLVLVAAGAAVGQLLIADGSATSAAGVGLRIVAVALPGIIVVTNIDATEVADALVQNSRVPARFAIGALAAFRLLPLLGQEWQLLRRARRARGMDIGARPWAWLHVLGSITFALLVAAIRRGVSLATAMDARGFDSEAPRTYARRQRFTTADALLIVGAVAVVALIMMISATTGWFHPVLS
jgi:energy-coupling factor transport system permease protein